MNIRASRIEKENVFVEWEGGLGEKFNIYLDGNVVRGKTTMKRHSIEMDSHREIKVINTETNESSSITFENDKQAMYDKLKNGVIDLSSMDNSVSREFKAFIVENGTSGDILRVNIDVSGQLLNAEARLVKNGDTICSSDSDKNIYLPFSFSDKPQEVIMKSGDKVETLKYDIEEESLIVDSRRYGFGESFVLGGRRVVLGQGSVVVIFEDSLPLSFPEEGIQTEITTDAGTLSSGAMMATNYIQIKSKEQSGDTVMGSHVYLYNPSTDQRLYATNISKSINSEMTIGECTWKSLNTSNVMSDTLKYCPTSVSIMAVSGSEINTSIVDNTGLSFSSDESSIFFGKYSQFKLSYENNKVLIMHLNPETGLYKVKAQFER
jgi:hypothetical protein